MATPGLSRVQQLCFSAAMVASMTGFSMHAGFAGSTQDRNRFRYEAVDAPFDSELTSAEVSNAKRVLIGCEQRRKESIERNENELKGCLDRSKIVSPLNVLWILGLGGSGLLLGMGLALSFGELGARKRMWIGGVLGLCASGGIALAVQNASKIGRLDAGAEYCRSVASTMKGSIGERYTNCIAHGQAAVKENAGSRSR